MKKKLQDRDHFSYIVDEKNALLITVLFLVDEEKLFQNMSGLYFSTFIILKNYYFNFDEQCGGNFFHNIFSCCLKSQCGRDWFVEKLKEKNREEENSSNLDDEWLNGIFFLMS